MFDRFSKFVGRKAVFATAAVVALTAAAPSASYAGGRHWHGGGGGGAAAAAMFGLAATGLAIAASRNAYAYDPGPAYYYEGGPAYYSGPGYGYGPDYYGSSNRYTYGGYKNPCAHGYSGYSCY